MPEGEAACRRPTLCRCAESLPAPDDAASVARSLFDEALEAHRRAPSTIAPPSQPPMSAPAYAPPPAPPAPRYDSEDHVLAKQSALLDLDRLRLRGIKLSREFTLADPLADIEFELRRHLAHIEEESSVAMMRDVLRVACSGLEMGATRLNILDLEGWAAEVTDDIRKYDPALAGLYRKYWRRGQSSPEMQLVMGLVGSIGMHTVKKFLRSMAPPRARRRGWARPAGIFAGVLSRPPLPKADVYEGDTDWTKGPARPVNPRGRPCCARVDHARTPCLPDVSKKHESDPPLEPWEIEPAAKPEGAAESETPLSPETPPSRRHRARRCGSAGAKTRPCRSPRTRSTRETTWSTPRNPCKRSPRQMRAR